MTKAMTASGKATAVRRIARLTLAVAFFSVAPAPAGAQQKLLTIDELYDPVKKVDLSGNPPTGLVWIDDTHYLSSRTDSKSQTTELVRVDALSGKADPFFDVAKMEASLAALPGVTRDEARRLSRLRSYTMNRARTAALLTIASDLYYYEFGGTRALRLTATPSEEEEATFSPDGRLVAFVRDNNLYVLEIGPQRERAITTDGGPDLLNGKLDWVYQEEIYGRGRFRAYWWSPDSSRVAFLQINERPVPRFTVIDHIPYHLTVETSGYPKAGDPNPAARLAIASAAGGAPRWVDLEKYTGGEFLVVSVDWTPDSKDVVYQVQNREQTWLDLNLADAGSASSRTLLRETTKAWVDVLGSPHWLKDDTFLWFSERSGWRHLYHYKRAGTLIRSVTSGPWEARTLHGVDETGGWVFFSGTERSHIGGDIYRIHLEGSRLSRLSQAPGMHSAVFSPKLTHYIATWSDVTTPQQVRLHRADGTEVRVIHEGHVDALAQYRLSKPEFLQVKTRDGFVMEAVMIKPPDFDPSRRYPVFQHIYGGPHAQQVRNAWGGTGYLFHQLLAQRGIIVWICDNRTASGKGAESTWTGYRRFGQTELQDIEDGVAWLKKQPYVDGSRLAISGWSYGGFMTSYVMTHSKSFAAGIAGGSVTDWRDYDTIYTERYMQMPQNNPEGYRLGSPRFAAKDLHGRLLLIHGTMDDNVHMQNTLQFVYELQKAGKTFELMLYPKSRHGVTDPALAKHLRALMLDFLTRTLLNGREASTSQP
jgi:dipeptidyl-peptidase-4